jgi:hypothetical protein
VDWCGIPGQTLVYRLFTKFLEQDLMCHEHTPTGEDGRNYIANLRTAIACGAKITKSG